MSLSVIFLITDAALYTESLAIDPAVSLNLTVPAPFFFAGNTALSMLIVDPKNPLTPNPYIFPISLLSKSSNLSNGIYLPIDITSSKSDNFISILLTFSLFE